MRKHDYVQRTTDPYSQEQTICWRWEQSFFNVPFVIELMWSDRFANLTQQLLPTNHWCLYFEVPEKTPLWQYMHLHMRDEEFEGFPMHGGCTFYENEFGKPVKAGCDYAHFNDSDIYGTRVTPEQMYDEVAEFLKNAEKFINLALSDPRYLNEYTLDEEPPPKKTYAVYKKFIKEM